MDIVKNAIIFGATGAIGSQAAINLGDAGYQIYPVSRNLTALEYEIAEMPQIDAIVWAQGANESASIIDYSESKLRDLLDANLFYITNSLDILLRARRLATGAQLVVISSLWAQFARPNKLNYIVSKSAVSGLVRSLSVDLGPQGISINAVAPGPVDSQMTRSQLSTNDLQRIISETPLKRLVKVEEVADLVTMLATGKLSGMTGQEFLIDGGWGVSKLV